MLNKKYMFLPIFLCLSVSICYAKTITFTTNISIDNNFTKEYQLNYSNDAFVIDGIKLKPIISINKVETNLSNINKNIIIKDNKHSYDFGFDINSISMNSINYIGFDLTGLKKYDDISYTDGKIRIIFEDLIDKGNLILSDNQAILYNPTTLSIDPTIELLPNSTDKAYTSGTTYQTPCLNNFATATTEFTDTQYNSTNATDGNYYILAAVSSSLNTRCKYYKFTFNLSGISIGSITSLNLTHTGSQSISGILGCDASLYILNASTGNWDGWTELSTPLDRTDQYNYTSNFGNVYNTTSGLVQFGVDIFCPKHVGDVSTAITDIAYVNVTYTTVSDTCTYGGSGDWFININDNCTLSSPNTVSGNMYLYGSNGFCNFQANQFAHAFYYNVSSLGTWYYNSYRWLY